LVVALVAGGLSLAIHSAHLLRRLEQTAVDVRFQIRGRDRGLVRDFVVVGVDDATFTTFEQRGLSSAWPFPRTYDARVIDALHRAGARVIAFDVQFTEPTRLQADNALIQAVSRAGHVVLSTTEVGPHGSTSIFGGDAVLRQIGARAGETNVFPDTDGTIRNTQYSILGLRTFGVAVAEAATGRRVPVSLFGSPGTQVPIDYAGPPGTVPSISYARVYLGRFRPREVAGKTVIVGATDSTLGDVHETPTSGNEMSGPELLANAAATVMAGLPLRNAPGWALPVAIALIAVLVFLSSLRWGTAGIVLTGLGLLAVYSLVAQLVFDGGTILDYADVAAAVILCTGGTMAVALWAERRERRRLRELFAADAPAIVEEVLSPGGAGRLEPTAIIAGYRIESPIGRGGMGVVYRATQLSLDRPVALKLIAADRAQDPVFRERFKRESRLAASIEHANVVPVYEAGEDDGLLFIAMRLVDGTDLAHVLARGRRLEPSRVVPLIAQLAAAIDAAHAQRLVHRDVKPANVLLTPDRPEHVYLTDFGVAKQIGADAGVTRAGKLVGTLEYLAPEQIRGEGAGPAADIYALTGVLHRCLTGQVPFPRDDAAAQMYAHVNAPPPAPSRIVPGLPVAIDKVIARGLAKDPADRFASAGELAWACGTALGVTIPEPEPPSRGRLAELPGAPVAPTVSGD
jgi:CHASE2 domain-containing sensor protein